MTKKWYVMAHDIPASEIVNALLDSRLYELKRSGNYLRGVCPSCGQKTLYIGTSYPYVLRCTRLNKCAFEQNVREALPDFFGNFAKRYPPTAENRDATADAYLALDRGFDLGKIRGWYEQGACPIHGTDQYIPTVRFYLDAARTRWWERLIGRKGNNGNKANFGGKRKDDGTLFRGDAWIPPGMAIEKLDRVFLVEGIFHAIALYHAGFKAVACFSCNTFPDVFIKEHAAKSVKWTVAMDADAAGSRWAKRHYQRLKQMGELASVCLPPKGQDWDDMWRAEHLTPVLISKGLYNGRLMVAESVEEKAFHYYVRNRRENFLLDFNNALYWIELRADFRTEVYNAVNAQAEKDAENRAAEAKAQRAKQAEQEKAAAKTTPTKASTEASTSSAEMPEQPQVKDDPDDPEGQILMTPEGRQIFNRHCGVDQISNVLPRCLYITKDPIMDEIRYQFQIAYANGTPDEIIPLEGSAITCPAEFNKALLNRSLGGTFDGAAKQFRILREGWLNRRLVTVSALPFVGYDPATKAYIFKDHAWHCGRRMTANDQGYFEINRQGVKTTLASVSITTEGEFKPDWLPNFVKAFHWQGLAVLAFFAASLFVQQIRSRDKSFPLLEFTGDPGAGKSTVLEFLWKLLGRDDYEGFDLLKSTAAGRRRAFSQVSNLPVVIIESDRDDGQKDSRQKQFGFDEVKPFFNGRGTGTLGVSRRGNETDESVFQASLIISQNAEVEGSEALLQRIVHCHADKKHHGEGTRDLARWFERQSVATVGGFLNRALTRERDFLETYAQAYTKYETMLSGGELHNERIIKNHAQVAACGDALGVIFGDFMTQELKTGLFCYLNSRALAREKRLANDHPVVEQFWDIYEYITIKITSSLRGDKGDPEPLNHARAQDGRIAINLNQLMEECRTWGQPVPDTAQLKKLLPLCRCHKYIGNMAINSRITGKTMRCWVFSRAAGFTTPTEDF